MKLPRRNRRNEYLSIPAQYKRMKRGPQVMLPKDIGAIMAYSGVGKESTCVDAGTGSGWLAVSLARVCKAVTSYETNKEFVKIAEYNKKISGANNLVIKNADISKGIKEKEVDLITLDMPDSDKIISRAYKALKSGGCIVGYLPHVEQVKAFVGRLGKYEFSDIMTMELISRSMLVREEGTRPATKGIWHTAYLVFGWKR
jgi:tRNA (adenine57-N1/adenine58-N1)-methyltransferase